MRNILIVLATIFAAGVISCSPTASELRQHSPVVEGKSVVESAAMKELLRYVRSQETTGFLIMRGNDVIVERNWDAPSNRTLSLFLYGKTDDGALLEDVASQQKSFIAVLMGIAVDKELVDVDKPVSDYVGLGWSKATADQEAQIRVSNILKMDSGLDDKFRFSTPAGSQFHYNTPVYAISKKILTEATQLPLAQITHEWLTKPLDMSETAWRERPSAFANVGNKTGLVTTPRDMARLGKLVLLGGITENGKRVVSASSIQAMLRPTAANPAYGWLWWLNGSEYVVKSKGRTEGQLIPAAPADLVAALGFLDRRLYIVPSLDLVVVRTGAAASDKDFDQQLWLRIIKTI